MTPMDISSDWLTLFCINLLDFLFDGSDLIFCLLEHSGLTPGYRRHYPLFLTIMSDWVKYSEHILVDFEETTLSFPCLRFITLHQTSVIVGCQQPRQVFWKTAPLTIFHQVDIVYLYIRQHKTFVSFHLSAEKAHVLQRFVETLIFQRK